MSAAQETAAQPRLQHRLPIHRGHRVTLPPHGKSPNPNDLATVRSWLSSRPRPWAIDLFCGAGGLSLGLEEAGFSVVAAADSDPVATETHAANIEGLTWTGDLTDPTAFISQLCAWGIDGVDLLAGGPPCQPFSLAGVPKIGHLVREGQRSAEDKRIDLWRSFFGIIDHLRPRAILFENVQGFTSAQDGAVLVTLVDEFKQRRYAVHAEVVEAWRFGVPQQRSRLLVVGTAQGVSFRWPQARERPITTLWDAIGDLPEVAPGTREEEQAYGARISSKFARRLRKGLKGREGEIVRDHITRAVRPDDAEIYRLLNSGDTYQDVPEHLRRYRADIFNDKYFRLSYHDVSRTITAHIAKDGYWYIHPSSDRTLSIREAARVQTFPDGFRFAGHPTSRYRQIGNAVPPMLASAIAASLRKAVEEDPEHTVSAGAGALEPRLPDFRRALLEWFTRNKRGFLWRRRRLTPWQLLLVEMCLHRTRADQVAHVADRLLALGKSPALFLANVDRLTPVLATLGLEWRIQNLVRAARFVHENLDGRIPESRQQLMAIPGVGDYIASAVLCFAFGRHTVLMDTNTQRIARRLLGGTPVPKTWRLRLALHELAGKEGSSAEWNSALLDLGALVCTARAPKCEICPIRIHCVTGRGEQHSRHSDDA